MTMGVIQDTDRSNYGHSYFLSNVKKFFLLYFIFLTHVGFCLVWLFWGMGLKFCAMLVILSLTACEVGCMSVVLSRFDKNTCF